MQRRNTRAGELPLDWAMVRVDEGKGERARSRIGDPTTRLPGSPDRSEEAAKYIAAVGRLSKQTKKSSRVP